MLANYCEDRAAAFRLFSNHLWHLVHGTYKPSPLSAALDCRGSWRVFCCDGQQRAKDRLFLLRGRARSEINGEVAKLTAAMTDAVDRLDRVDQKEGAGPGGTSGSGKFPMYF